MKEEGASKKILKALQSGRVLTRMDCIKDFNCVEAPARITELRQQGLPINTRMVTQTNGKRHAEWSIGTGQLNMFEEE